MTGEPVVNGYWQVAPGAGKRLDSSELTVSSETVQRERAIFSDPAGNNSHARTRDFLAGLESGLAVRNIYNEALVNQLNYLLQQVHDFRIVMEEAML